MDRNLTIPFADDLTKEAGWIQLDHYLYFIPRLHLHIEQQQTSEFAFGDILATFRTSPSAETEVTKVLEEEITVVNPKETIRALTLSDDLIRRISATIAGAAKGPGYEVSTDISTSLKRTIHSSVGVSIRSTPVSKRESRTFAISQRIKPGIHDLQLAVARYRRYSQSVFLHYIDYLFVEYKTTTFGLRKKKQNLPRPVRDTHINYIPINMPLFKLFFWELERESSLLYTEAEYQDLPKVMYPDWVTFDELRERIALPLPSRAEPPTLYTLSNIAFPLRWVDRKGPWTREELEKTELEEAEESELHLLTSGTSAAQKGGKHKDQVPDIFISYARKDVSIVEQIYKILRKKKHCPWMDTHSIKGGENWLRAIYRAIDECHIFLAVLSNNSVSRRGVIQKELKKALDKWEGMLPDDIYIIPLRIDDCPVPELLNDIQVIDWENGKGRKKLFEAIETGLEQRGPS